MKTFVHYRRLEKGAVQARGGATVCVTTEENRTSFGIAVCGPKDNFCRRIGRRISEARVSEATPRVAFLTSKEYRELAEAADVVLRARINQIAHVHGTETPTLTRQY